MIVAIVQARMGSTRLPGKVLRPAAGQTFLEHLVERLRGAPCLDQIVVATSTLPGDDPIAALCRDRDIACFRGDERDVMDRYYRAAVEAKATTVVRITADCPLIDPVIVTRCVEYHRAHADLFDLVTNRHPLTFPDGLDVDVMALAGLERAWRKAVKPSHREHVVPYFWEEGQRVHNVEHPDNLFRTHRWTVDYEEDAQLVAAIFEALYRSGRIFGMDDILAFLSAHPQLTRLNAQYLPSA